MSNFKDIPIGTKYGRWEVIAFVVVKTKPRGQREAVWLLRCQCGKERQFGSGQLGTSDKCRKCQTQILTRNASKVQTRYATTHGKSGTRTHAEWQKMMRYFRVPSDRQRLLDLKRYGESSIRVHRPWFDIATFIADVGECPSNDHVLRRRRPILGFVPGNVYWDTRRNPQPLTTAHQP